MANVVGIDNETVIVNVEDQKVKVSVCEDVVNIEIGSTGPQGPRGTQVLSGPTDPDISLGLIGDQYINTDTGELFGPKTISGWGDGVPLGNNDPEDLGQVYTQVTPATEWNIAHTLTFTPNIIVVDPAGTVIEGDYEYISANHIVARFSASTAGKAYLS